MPTLTRGPLPAGVYWRRRVFVVLLAVTLVFLVASVLGGGSDARDDDVPLAQQAGGVQASATITVADRKAKRKDRRNRAIQGPTYDPALLAVEPNGNCEPADVRITPAVDRAVAGRPVTVALKLQTVQADACYFRLGADKISVKISKGEREVWTSRECPGPVPTESVVLRRVIATVVEMTWTPYPEGRRGAECPGTVDWLMPGELTASAAVLGGEPAESDFVLAPPTPETITVSPDPKDEKKNDRNGDKKDRKGQRGGLDGETAQEEAQGDQSQQQQSSDRSTDEPRR